MSKQGTQTVITITRTLQRCSHTHLNGHQRVGQHTAPQKSLVMSHAKQGMMILNAVTRAVTQLYAKWAVKHPDVHGDSPRPRHSQHDTPPMPLPAPSLPPICTHMSAHTHMGRLTCTSTHGHTWVNRCAHPCAPTDVNACPVWYE